MSAPALTEAERAEVIDWAKACEGHAIADGKPEGPIRNVSGLAACRAGLVAYVESLVVTRVPVVEPIPAPVQPETAKPELTVWFGSMPESNGKHNWTVMLGHKDDVWSGITIERTEYKDRARYEADRLRHLIGELAEAPDICAYDADLRTSEAESVRPQAEPVAVDLSMSGEIWPLICKWACCSKGAEAGKAANAIDDAIREAVSRNAGAAPVAQADSAMLDWLERHDGEFHNIDRIASIVGTGFLTGPLSTSRKHQTLRAAILAAMKGTP